MAWFFETNIVGSTHTINGENAKHIVKSLRMRQGEELTLCDDNKIQYTCVISSITESDVNVTVTDQKPCENEPNTAVYLFQAIPKGDKMDYIIQKAVELGATVIVPVITARCVSRPDEKTCVKKVARWQKIALEAAKQSHRGIIPTVKSVVSLQKAITISKDLSSTIVFYECGGENPGNIINKNEKSIGIYIGPEGGFEKDEISFILENGGKCGTLGKRILRAETAPLAAMSIVMYITENF